MEREHRLRLAIGLHLAQIMKRHIVIPVVLAALIGAGFLSGKVQIATPATAGAADSAAVALPAGTSSAEQMTARAKVFLAAL